MRVAQPDVVRRSRVNWLRVLRLYAMDHELDSRPGRQVEHPLVSASSVHARSRFRSLAAPGRFAVYTVHDAAGPLLALGPPSGHHEHTLVAVREFRRVPLDASSLALVLFTARPGRAVQVVAALADFVERAVDLYQPGYLLLAHSLEEPRTCLLLMAVHDAAALGAAAPAAFSVDDLLPELEPMLAAEPECYAYDPERMPISSPRTSPSLSPSPV